ncbi:MAG: single-stranded DNA-binding protein [Acidimicrobiales bacterium]
MTTPTVGMVGNLTDDPELRFSIAGKPFLRGRLSVKPYVPGATEKPEAVFYSLVCFGSLAENVAESCHKGSRIVVAGNLEHETWTDRDGQEHATVKVVADAIGPDLRFTSATVNQARRSGPAKPDTTITGLVGASPATAIARNRSDGQTPIGAAIHG